MSKKKKSLSNYAVECKYTDKSSFKVTRELLEKLHSESLEANKPSLLILGIAIDDQSFFELKCELSIVKKDKK